MNKNELKTYVTQILSFKANDIDYILANSFDESQIKKYDLNIKAFDKYCGVNIDGEKIYIFSLKEKVKAEVVSRLVRYEYIAGVANN